MTCTGEQTGAEAAGVVQAGVVQAVGANCRQHDQTIGYFTSSALTELATVAEAVQRVMRCMMWEPHADLAQPSCQETHSPCWWCVRHGC
jgi:hypothetical protein